MPFALVNMASQLIPGLSPAINEVIPGWVLSDNLYMVMRSEIKFRVRGEKTRKLPQTICGVLDYENEVFRPAIIELILDARNRLESVNPSVAKIYDQMGCAVYTDKQIKGLGKNYLTESRRIESVQTYSRFILYYVLRAMWRALKAGVHIEHILVQKKSKVNVRQRIGQDDSDNGVFSKQKSIYFNSKSTILRKKHRVAVQSDSTSKYEYSCDKDHADAKTEDCKSNKFNDQ